MQIPLLSNLPRHDIGVPGYACVRIDPGGLDALAREEVLSATYAVARDAFDQEESPGFLEDVRRHVLGSQNLCALVADATGELLAFCGWRMLPASHPKTLYISGICVGSQLRGSGAGRKLISHIAEAENLCGDDLSYIVLRTQNPAMSRCLSHVRLGRGAFYSFGAGPVPPDIVSLVETVAAAIGDAHVDSATLLSRGVYGQCLYGPSADICGASVGTHLEALRHREGDASYCVRAL